MIIKKFVVFILVGLVLGLSLLNVGYHNGFMGTVAGQSNQTVKELNKRGLDLLISGNYSESLGYFDKALVIFPDNAQVLDNKGFALYSLGNFSGALYYYDKALTIEPNLTGASNDKVAALLRLGNQFLNSKNYSDAVGFYDKVLAINA